MYGAVTGYGIVQYSTIRIPRKNRLCLIESSSMFLLHLEASIVPGEYNSLGIRNMLLAGHDVVRTVSSQHVKVLQ